MSDEIYTEKPASSILPVASRDAPIPALKTVYANLEIILTSMDSKHSTAFKRGQFVTINNIKHGALKQYLYSLNLFIGEIVKSSTDTTTKKGLLYTRIFDIINSSYELLDTATQTKNSNDDSIAMELNCALLGFALKNIKIYYDEYRNQKKRD
jgi:hypothetical protein